MRRTCKCIESLSFYLNSIRNTRNVNYMNLKNRSEKLTVQLSPLELLRHSVKSLRGEMTVGDDGAVEINFPPDASARATACLQAALALFESRWT